MEMMTDNFLDVVRKAIVNSENSDQIIASLRAALIITYFSLNKHHNMESFIEKIEDIYMYYEERANLLGQLE